MIYGERVKQAREFRGLTQKELGEGIWANQSTISQIEKGSIEPSGAVVENIVLRTSFPLGFFKQPPKTFFSPSGAILFRARRSVSARNKQIAIQYAKLVFEMLEKLEKGLRSISVNIPNYEDPIEAARLTRRNFSLPPDSPVPNVINCLERNGIIVLVLPIPIEGIDAFCAWAGPSLDRPVIVTHSGKPADRLRFNVVHELGHLVLHRGKEGASSHDWDEQAFEFAAEFLMPTEKIKQEIVSPVSLYSLAKLKPRWRVSIQALIRRAKELQVITGRQYSYLMMQLSAYGWKKNEPANLDVPAERPRLLSQVIEMVYGKPVNYRKIASDMCLPLMLVKNAIEECAGVDRADGEGEEQKPAQIFRLNKEEAG